MYIYIYIGLSHFLVLVTTRILASLLVDSYKPSFATITRNEDNLKIIAFKNGCFENLKGMILIGSAPNVVPQERHNVVGSEIRPATGDVYKYKTQCQKKGGRGGNLPTSTYLAGCLNHLQMGYIGVITH